MSGETEVDGPPARCGQTSVLDEGIAMLQALRLEDHERAVGRRRHARRQPRRPDTLFGRPYWQVVRHLTLAAVTGTLIGLTLSALEQPAEAPAAPPVAPSAQPEIPVTELAPTTQPSWTVEPTRFERRATSTRPSVTRARPRATRTSAERPRSTPVRTPVRTPVQTPVRPTPTPPASSTPPESTSAPSTTTEAEVTDASQGVITVDVGG